MENKKILIGIIFLFGILIMGFISAENEVCCEKTKSDVWCQDVLESQCAGNSQTSINECLKTTFCKMGFCYDNEEGTCAPASKSECEDNSGIFYESETEKCEKACCALGENTDFITKGRCELLSNRLGTDFDWGNSISEDECKYVSEEKGACIIKGGCESLTENECNEKEGEFNEDVSCSVLEFDSCYDEENDITRENGESWCVYDGYVGDGKDIVGSIHWRYYCEDGEIKSESCGDQRTGVCAEIEVTSDVTDEKISKAICRTNLARMCYGLEVSECEENIDCKIHEVNIDSRFYFSACVPKYPPGFELFFTEEDASYLDEDISSMTEGNQICNIGSQTCEVVYIKEWDGIKWTWNCLENCDCLENEFEEKMNDFCISLGDCGGYINIEGKITNSGYDINGNTWKKGIKDYSENINENKENAPEYLGVLRNVESVTSIKNIDIINSGLTLGSKIRRQLADWTFDIFGLIGIGDTKIRQVNFVCAPWQPPEGGADCEKCNENSLKPCTEYRCKSLGSACELVNTETENPLCINTDPNDFKYPEITFGEVDGDYLVNEETNKAKITFEDGSCIYEYSKINVSVKTDELARCFWSLKPGEGSLEEKDNYFNEQNQYTYEHKILDFNIYGEDKTSIYIQCVDYAGNYNIAEYIIDICISPQPDLLSPTIISTEPENEGYFAKGTSETDLKIFLSEQAECKIDTAKGIDYENMKTKMLCNEKDLVEEGIYISDWYCKTILTGLTTENKFYIKCNDTSGNIMDEEEYTIYETENELSIISVSPLDGTIREAPINEENSLTLKVTTSGGVDNGIAVCAYKFVDKGWNDYFFETNSNSHEQEFTRQLDNGDYSIEIDCEDEIGNAASKTITLTISKDDTPPKVISYSTEGSKLTIVTDEESSCYYNMENEDFDIEDEGTSMEVGWKTEHVISSWSPYEDYYVKCKDIWDNINHSAFSTSSGDEDDSLLPIIARAYYKSGYLMLITDRKAKCYYSFENSYCTSEDINEGVSMTGSSASKEHSAEWNEGVIYYIRCENQWGYGNQKCGIVIEPSSLI